MTRPLPTLLLLAGCARNPAPTLEQYRLDYAPPAAEGQRLPAILRVALFDVADLYNRDAIAWRRGEHEMGTYAAHRWMTTPPRMVTDLLARDLSAAEGFEAVLQGVVPLAADYELTGYVERFEELVDGRNCAAALDVRLLLVRVGGAAAPLFQRSYTTVAPCEGGGPEGFVAAMSGALQAVSAAARQDVHAAAAADLQAAPAITGAP